MQVLLIAGFESTNLRIKSKRSKASEAPPNHQIVLDASEHRAMLCLCGNVPKPMLINIGQLVIKRSFHVLKYIFRTTNIQSAIQSASRKHSKYHAHNESGSITKKPRPVPPFLWSPNNAYDMFHGSIGLNAFVRL